MKVDAHLLRNHELIGQALATNRGVLMSGRSARRAPAAGSVAVVVLFGLLAGCSGGSQPPAARASGGSAGGTAGPAAASTASSSPAPYTGVQQSPKGVVEAFLQRISRGEAEQVCELVDQPLLEALKEQGGCEAALSPPSVTKAAKQLGDARVDVDKIHVVGDTATVEDGAVTLKGKPVATPLSRLVRHDDRWWITTPG